MKTINKLIGEFERVARTMASKYDLRVVPSDRCSTDGRTIFYPGNAEMLDGASAAALNGWLDHEVGHITEEDRHKENGREVPMDMMKRATTKKKKLLLNAFEDIRMERQKSQEYVGMAENLKASMEHAAKLQMAAEKRREDEGGEMNFWHMYAVGVVLKAEGQNVSFMPREIREALETTVEEIEASRFTRWASENEELVNRALRKLDDAAEEKGKGDGESGDGGKGDGESGDGGEGDGGDGGEGDGGDGGEGDGDGSKGGSEDADGSGGSGAGEEDEDEEDEETEEEKEKFIKGVRSESEMEDLTEAVKAEIDESSKIKYKGDKGGYGTDPAMYKLDKWRRPLPDKSGYHKAEEMVSRQIGGMKSKLVNLMKTQSESTQINAQQEGTLDDDALFAVPLGRRDVFTKTREGEKMDTAVTLFIDQSGSMGSGSSPGCGAYYARVVAVALAKTFSLINIPCEVIGFHNTFAGGRGGGYGGHLRMQPYVYDVFKDFDESYQSAKYRLGSITGYEDNADGEAVMEAAKRLAMRTEKRKVMFVISDGQPQASSVDQRVLSQHLKDTVRTITKAGIEVVGFGAETESVKEYYNAETGAKSLVINDIEQLAPKVYMTMRKLFLNNRRARR
jgi:cobalamin biosynthesis protein CobT